MNVFGTQSEAVSHSSADGMNNHRNLMLGPASVTQFSMILLFTDVKTLSGSTDTRPAGETKNSNNENYKKTAVVQILLPLPITTVVAKPCPPSFVT